MTLQEQLQKTEEELQNELFYLDEYEAGLCDDVIELTKREQIKAVKAFAEEIEKYVKESEFDYRDCSAPYFMGVLQEKINNLLKDI